MDTATPPNTDTTQETGKLVFTEPIVKTFSVPMGRGKKKKMIPIKIERREPVMKWIPVTERLPDSTRTVLTTFIESGVVKVDTLNYFREPLGWTDFRYNEELGRPKSYEVTAWMPLPTPWRGENDEL